MFLRAAIAFVILPGVVGYAVPILLAPSGEPARGWIWSGAALVLSGSVLLLWCVRDFYVAGRGTLAPWSPPSSLVVVGLYRWSRNPMYVAVLTVLVGWAIRFESLRLLGYAAVVALAFHLRVLRYEEPWLRASFGDAWDNYRSRVPRWLGRRRST